MYFIWLYKIVVTIFFTRMEKLQFVFAWLDMEVANVILLGYKRALALKKFGHGEDTPIGPDPHALLAIQAP